jgi:hypothetical protein
VLYTAPKLSFDSAGSVASQPSGRVRVATEADSGNVVMKTGVTDAARASVVVIESDGDSADSDNKELAHVSLWESCVDRVDTDDLVVDPDNDDQCFGEDNVEFAVDPYYMGLFLAAGCAHEPNVIFSSDRAVVKYLQEYAAQLGLCVTSSPDAAYSRIVCPKNSAASNPVVSALRRQGLVKNGWGPDNGVKRIVSSYLFASEAVRLRVLAGLLDCDGCYMTNSHQFYFTQSAQWHKQLFCDAVFLARSLGFSVVEHARELPNVGSVLVAVISGDVERIPTLVPRNQPQARASNSGWLEHSIARVECAKHATRFYGFEVDGNQRFLRADFLVVHNSGFEESMKVRCFGGRDAGISLFHKRSRKLHCLFVVCPLNVRSSRS